MHRACGELWSEHIDDGVQMLCPESETGGDLGAGGMTHNDCIWFRENSRAQAALGRVRELADRLTANGPSATPLTQPFAAHLIREALGGE